MQKPSKLAQIPRIRFSGFTDPWERRKLGEVADIVGGGTPSTAISEYWDGDIDWYAPAEISDQIFVNSSQRKITTEGLINSSAKILPVGTILFTSRAGIGKTVILAKESCTNQGFQSIIPHKKELDSYFIFSRTEELKRYGETVGAGSTFVEVSGKQMSNMNLMMPSLAEQTKIGELFANLDNLITLPQRKVEKLQKIKKSCLQNLFPQNNQNTPKIRFKNFSDEWVENKLEKIANRFDNLRIPISADKRISGSIPYYGANGIQDYVKGYTHNGEFILIAEDGANDLKNYPVQYVNGKFWANNHTHVVQAITEIANNKFLKYAISQINIERILVGGGRAKLNANAMMDLCFNIPNLTEQEKIGAFFSKLDKLISLQQRKVEKLKNIKKALLNKMFI